MFCDFKIYQSQAKRTQLFFFSVSIQLKINVKLGEGEESRHLYSLCVPLEIERDSGRDLESELEGVDMNYSTA